jgi:predicted dehydrogenase
MALLRAAVGGTSFGARVHVPALRNAGFDVVALIGRDPEKTTRRAARLDVANALTSLDDALDLVDVVTIATPPHTHAPLSIQALAAGKAVVCEKPFALSAPEAEDMRAAAERAGVPAYVGHEFRWAEDRAVLARAVADGLIGEPRLAALVSFIPFVADPETPMMDWWFDADRGGGWFGASGSHVIDQLRTTLGEFDTVEATLPLVSDRPGTVAEDSFVVHARLASGCDVVLQSTAGSWGPNIALTRIAGSHGTVWTDDGAVFLADRSGTRQLPVPEELQLPPPPPVSDDPRQRFSHLELGPYTRLSEALRCAMEDRPLPAGPKPATFADGVAVLQVMDAVRRSAETRECQVVGHTTEQLPGSA